MEEQRRPARASTASGGGDPALPRGRVLVANPSADLYGSDRMMLETVRGLVASGWQVTVAYSQPGPLKDALLRAGAQLRPCTFPVLRKANLVPSGWPQLIIALARGVPRIHRVLREVAPNVVYVNTVTIPFWVMMARLRAIPVVVHVHEAEVSVHPIVRAGLSAPNLLATSIIYNSEVSKLVGHTGMVRGRPHQVIHNGVAGPPTRVEPRARLHERVELLYVGRLSPRKGVDVAVRALALLRERGVAARLTVVGAVFPGYEWYEEQMQALVAELGLSQHMRSVGFQSDVWPWLAASDIVLVPSRSEESFGNAVIEAALAGRPSVVSDHSGLREARAGLSAVRAVPAEQPGAIADAVVGLVQDWPGSRADAMRDAVLADAAYAPESYRRAVADVLARATRPTRRRWPGRLASWGRR